MGKAVEEGGITGEVVAGSNGGRALIGDTSSGGGGGGCGLTEVLVGVTWGDVVMETGEGGFHVGDMEWSGDGLTGRWNESGC